MKYLIGLLGLVFILTGCTYVNKPLNPVTEPLEGRKLNDTRSAVGLPIRPLDAPYPQHVLTTAPATAPTLPQDDDGYFVGIAISGGGSRSANFSAACMFQLQKIGLLQHVDYISSVSGGSLTAAYYCLNGDEWNPGNVQEKLTHPFANDIILQSIIPWNAVLLLFTDWDRTDLLADSFRANLFSRNGKTLTFGDLRADRPRLLINSTDLQSGRRFVFCNETFDEINSDLSQYPIANAVAASAAFPIVMHHMTLRDYSTAYKQYRHLIDGGVTDNLGVETLVETYEGQSKAAEQAGRPDPYPNGAIIIVFDARTTFNAKLSDRGDIGFLDSMRAGTNLTSTALLARAASATMADIVLKYSSDEIDARTLRQQMKELETTGCVTLKDRRGQPAQVVHLSLARVNELSNLPFSNFSDSVNNISTYFNIDDVEAYNLYVASELLMKEIFLPVLEEIAEELAATAAGARNDEIRMTNEIPMNQCLK